MKILYVISSTQTGGAEKALSVLANAMHKTGNKIKVLCIKPLGKVACEMEKEGIEIKSIYSKLPGKIIKHIHEEIKQFQPDIVHAMLFRAIEYTRMACAGSKTKLVVTPHFDLSKKSFLLRLADRFLKVQDTLAIAESFSTAEYLIKQQGYAKDKVFLLPNSIDKTEFYKDISLREQERAQNGFHVKTVVFLCVARLAGVKDPMTLLQAFRNLWLRHPDARLIYVGEGEERKRLEQYIETSGLKNSVILAGEQDRINDYLNMADVFVLPSLEESLPLALLEALQVGLPCVVSNVGDMPRWVEHGKNGYVFNPQDITLLSCFLNILFENEGVRRQMGEKSLEKAAQIEDNLTHYQQIYQQLVSGKFSREN